MKRTEHEISLFRSLIPKENSDGSNMSKNRKLHYPNFVRAKLNVSYNQSNAIQLKKTILDKSKHKTLSPEKLNLIDRQPRLPIGALIREQQIIQVNEAIGLQASPVKKLFIDRQVGDVDRELQKWSENWHRKMSPPKKHSPPHSDRQAQAVIRPGSVLIDIPSGQQTTRVLHDAYVDESFLIASPRYSQDHNDRENRQILTQNPSLRQPYIIYHNGSEYQARVTPRIHKGAAIEIIDRPPSSQPSTSSPPSANLTLATPSSPRRTDSVPLRSPTGVHVPLELRSPCAVDRPPQKLASFELTDSPSPDRNGPQVMDTDVHANVESKQVDSTMTATGIQRRANRGRVERVRSKSISVGIEKKFLHVQHAFSNSIGFMTPSTSATNFPLPSHTSNQVGNGNFERSKSVDGRMQGRIAAQRTHKDDVVNSSSQINDNLKNTLLTNAKSAIVYNQSSPIPKLTKLIHSSIYNNSNEQIEERRSTSPLSHSSLTPNSVLNKYKFSSVISSSVSFTQQNASSIKILTPQSTTTTLVNNGNSSTSSLNPKSRGYFSSMRLSHKPSPSLPSTAARQLSGPPPDPIRYTTPTGNHLTHTALAQVVEDTTASILRQRAHDSEAKYNFHSDNTVDNNSKKNFEPVSHNSCDEETELPSYSSINMFNQNVPFLPHDMLSQEDNELPMDNNVVMSLSPLLPNFDETEFSSHHAGVRSTSCSTPLHSRMPEKRMEPISALRRPLDGSNNNNTHLAHTPSNRVSKRSPQRVSLSVDACPGSQLDTHQKTESNGPHLDSMTTTASQMKVRQSIQDLHSPTKRYVRSCSVCSSEKNFIPLSSALPTSNHSTTTTHQKHNLLSRSASQKTNSSASPLRSQVEPRASSPAPRFAPSSRVPLASVPASNNHAAEYLDAKKESTKSFANAPALNGPPLRHSSKEDSTLNLGMKNFQSGWKDAPLLPISSTSTLMPKFHPSASTTTHSLQSNVYSVPGDICSKDYCSDVHSNNGHLPYSTTIRLQPSPLTSAVVESSLTPVPVLGGFHEGSSVSLMTKSIDKVLASDTTRQRSGNNKLESSEKDVMILRLQTLLEAETQRRQDAERLLSKFAESATAPSHATPQLKSANGIATKSALVETSVATDSSISGAMHHHVSNSKFAPNIPSSQGVSSSRPTSKGALLIKDIVSRSMIAARFLIGEDPNNASPEDEFVDVNDVDDDGNTRNDDDDDNNKKAMKHVIVNFNGVQELVSTEKEEDNVKKNNDSNNNNNIMLDGLDRPYSMGSDGIMTVVTPRLYTAERLQKLLNKGVGGNIKDGIAYANSILSEGQDEHQDLNEGLQELDHAIQRGIHSEAKCTKNHSVGSILVNGNVLGPHKSKMVNINEGNEAQDGIVLEKDSASDNNKMKPSLQSNVEMVHTAICHSTSSLASSHYDPCNNNGYSNRSVNNNIIELTSTLQNEHFDPTTQNRYEITENVNDPLPSLSAVSGHQLTPTRSTTSQAPQTRSPKTSTRRKLLFSSLDINAALPRASAGESARGNNGMHQQLDETILAISQTTLNGNQGEVVSSSSFSANIKDRPNSNDLTARPSTSNSLLHQASLLEHARLIAESTIELAPAPYIHRESDALLISDVTGVSPSFAPHPVTARTSSSKIVQANVRSHLQFDPEDEEKEEEFVEADVVVSDEGENHASAPAIHNYFMEQQQHSSQTPSRIGTARANLFAGPEILDAMNNRNDGKSPEFAAVLDSDMTSPRNSSISTTPQATSIGFHSRPMSSFEPKLIPNIPPTTLHITSSPNNQPGSPPSTLHISASHGFLRSAALRIHAGDALLGGAGHADPNSPNTAAALEFHHQQHHYRHNAANTKDENNNSSGNIETSFSLADAINMKSNVENNSSPRLLPYSPHASQIQIIRQQVQQPEYYYLKKIGSLDQGLNHSQTANVASLIPSASPQNSCSVIPVAHVCPPSPSTTMNQANLMYDVNPVLHLSGVSGGDGGTSGSQHAQSSHSMPIPIYIQTPNHPYTNNHNNNSNHNNNQHHLNLLQSPLTMSHMSVASSFRNGSVQATTNSNSNYNNNNNNSSPNNHLFHRNNINENNNLPPPLKKFIPILKVSGSSPDRFVGSPPPLPHSSVRRNSGGSHHHLNISSNQAIEGSYRKNEYASPHANNDGYSNLSSFLVSNLNPNLTFINNNNISMQSNKRSLSPNGLFNIPMKPISIKQTSHSSSTTKNKNFSSSNKSRCSPGCLAEFKPSRELHHSSDDVTDDTPRYSSNIHTFIPPPAERAVSAVSNGSVSNNVYTVKNTTTSQNSSPLVLRVFAPQSTGQSSNNIAVCAVQQVSGSSLISHSHATQYGGPAIASQTASPLGSRSFSSLQIPSSQ